MVGRVGGQLAVWGHGDLEKSGGRVRWYVSGGGSMAVRGQLRQTGFEVTTFWDMHKRLPAYVTRPSASMSLMPLSVMRMWMKRCFWVGSSFRLTYFHVHGPPNLQFLLAGGCHFLRSGTQLFRREEVGAPLSHRLRGASDLHSE